MSRVSIRQLIYARAQSRCVPEGIYECKWGEEERGTANTHVNHSAKIRLSSRKVVPLDLRPPLLCLPVVLAISVAIERSLEVGELESAPIPQTAKLCAYTDSGLDSYLQYLAAFYVCRLAHVPPRSPAIPRTALIERMDGALDSYLHPIRASHPPHRAIVAQSQSQPRTAFSSADREYPKRDRSSWVLEESSSILARVNLPAKQLALVATILGPTPVALARDFQRLEFTANAFYLVRELP
ncbi:hypothetical protein NMY22_g11018 [Coprinellus aureogranulatus]|nr:hypothetical protein NMY22_g11018 [Coprinellus aureogranulatus]